MKDLAQEAQINNRLTRLEQQVKHLEALQAAAAGATVAIHDVLEAIIRSHPDVAQLQLALSKIPKRKFQTPYHLGGYEESQKRLLRSLQGG